VVLGGEVARKGYKSLGGLGWVGVGWGRGGSLNKPTLTNVFLNNNHKN
jgi:hypothetical protein